MAMMRYCYDCFKNGGHFVKKCPPFYFVKKTLYGAGNGALLFRNMLTIDLLYCIMEIVQFSGGDRVEWHLDKKRPLSSQIGEQLCLQIALDQLKPNQRLLSVRELAVLAGVNPNTVQHSFEALEEQGILYSVRGSGWYVSENTDLAKQTLQSFLKEKTASYFAEMAALGLDREAVKNYIKEWCE